MQKSVSTCIYILTQVIREYSKRLQKIICTSNKEGNVDLYTIVKQHCKCL